MVAKTFFRGKTFFEEKIGASLLFFANIVLDKSERPPRG
jgi:hypothetical protein